MKNQNSNQKKDLIFLVVDDEEVLREAIAYCLKNQGYSVMTAPDGVAAVEILENFPNQYFLISDINMPRMGGYSLMMRICEKKMPVRGAILCSGQGIDDHLFGVINDCAAENAIPVTFLEKPVGLEQVESQVASMITFGESQLITE